MKKLKQFLCLTFNTLWFALAMTYGALIIIDIPFPNKLFQYAWGVLSMLRVVTFVDREWNSSIL